ncbi:MAG: L,D-transpeptidase [Legionella sp.]|nr:L,D-transpeptidase [Legionella sp.]
MKIIWIYILMLLCAVGSISAKETSSVDEKILRLQILLDQKNFSPGKVDGRNGYFTKEALKYSKVAKSEVESDELADEPDESDEIADKPEVSEQDGPLYTTYTIRSEDEKFIGKAPEKPAEQAKRKSLPYINFAEMIAERFHTDVPFLKEINQDKDMKKIKVGDEVKVPNVKPFLIEDLKEKKANKKKDYSKRIIKIDVKKRLLFLYEDDKETLLAVFPITPGSKSLPAPKGTWKVKAIAYLPWFRHDKQMLKKGTRSGDFNNVPPGPNSDVGVVWIALSKKGIGIHGTDSPETIGRSFSHGCIRLTNWDAIKLSKMITKGVTVQID